MLYLVLEIIGLLGGIIGLAGFYAGSRTLLIAGLIIAALLCMESSELDLGTAVMTRVIVVPVLSVVGMFICRFALNMSLKDGFAASLLWIYLVYTVLYLILAIVAVLQNKR